MLDPSVAAFVSRCGEGRSFWILQDLCTIKADSESTGGAYALLEAKVFPGTSGPPPHIHHGEAESFYILEGQFSVTCGDESVTAGAGSFVHVPAGVVHTFRNVGDTVGRVLILIVPAGLEKFFEQISRPVSERTAPPPIDPGLIEKLMRLAPQYRLEFPPPK